MIEVHHLNNSRSQRVLWLLEELGQDYTIIPYARDPVTMLAPASLKAIHPLGKSPVLQDKGQVLAESAAIIDYLVREYDDGTLSPAEDAPSFNDYRYWMHYAEGSLMQQMMIRLYLTRVGEPAALLLQRINGAIGMHLDFVEKELAGKQFLTGSTLTAADIQMSFPLELAVIQHLATDQHPGIRELVGRWHARPAYQRALERGGPYAYA